VYLFRARAGSAKTCTLGSVRLPSSLLEPFDARVHAQILAQAQVLVGACTPLNLRDERHALTLGAKRGDFRLPVFEYAIATVEQVEAPADAHPFWKERAAELRHEAELVRTRESRPKVALHLSLRTRGCCIRFRRREDRTARTGARLTRCVRKCSVRYRVLTIACRCIRV
jgi:hypothetical protein